MLTRSEFNGEIYSSCTASRNTKKVFTKGQIFRARSTRTTITTVSRTCVHWINRNTTTLYYGFANASLKLDGMCIAFFWWTELTLDLQYEVIWRELRGQRATIFPFCSLRRRASGRRRGRQYVFVMIFFSFTVFNQVIVGSSLINH